MIARSVIASRLATPGGLSNLDGCFTVVGGVKNVNDDGVLKLNFGDLTRGVRLLIRYFFRVNVGGI